MANTKADKLKLRALAAKMAADLRDGASADIWFESRDPNERHLMQQVKDTQATMRRAADLLDRFLKRQI